MGRQRQRLNQRLCQRQGQNLKQFQQHLSARKTESNGPARHAERSAINLLVRVRTTRNAGPGAKTANAEWTRKMSRTRKRNSHARMTQSGTRTRRKLRAANGSARKKGSDARGKRKRCVSKA